MKPLCSCIADPVLYASSRLGHSSLAVYMPSKKSLIKLSLNIFSLAIDGVPLESKGRGFRLRLIFFKDLGMEFYSVWQVHS